MKKLNCVVGFLFFVFIFSIGFSQTDFRGVNWGVDALTVKKAEQSKLIQEDESRLIYNCQLSDIKGKLIYTFTNSGKLMRAKYFLTPDYLNVTFFLRDYRMFLELLIQKYGQPIVFPGNDSSGYKEGEWAINLSEGEIRLETKWSLVKTDVLLTLSKMKDNYAVQIDYISRDFFDTDLNERKKQIVKDL